MILIGAFFVFCFLYADLEDRSIIFRAFQGMGGSGIYSMVMVVVPEIVPLSRLGLASGLVAGVYAASSILEPLLGSVIVDNTTWRWVFFLKYKPPLYP
jgi:MFS family permease